MSIPAFLGSQYESIVLTSFSSHESPMTENSFFLNKRVRVLVDDPIFHRRKGRVVRVNPTKLVIRFEGNPRYEEFRPEQVEIVPEFTGSTNDLAALHDDMTDDTGCWINEALAAFEAAKAQKEKELFRQLQKKK